VVQLREENGGTTSGRQPRRPGPQPAWLNF